MTFVDSLGHGVEPPLDPVRDLLTATRNLPRSDEMTGFGRGGEGFGANTVIDLAEAAVTVAR
ncbi:hypothetical protein ACGFJ7_34820 [Actinoplanes sp. NPDC048988]|uniref:hypothetical protein n=1 Tax=Actinoplanes sp. NPDC048988 TaxID=3363901 RepID=UPI00371742F9